MLEGKVILVTRATEFVGTPVVAACLSEGARVFAQDPGFADPDIAGAFRTAHAGVTLISERDPSALVQFVIASAGQLDGLVPNDGFPAIRARIEDHEARDLRDGLEAMVVEPFQLIKAAVPHMKQRGYGRIMVPTSAVPCRGLSNYGMYVTARGAQNAMVITLARELAKSGITVNAVAPNFVENPTYFPEDLLADEAALAKITAQIPMGRMGNPAEVANIVTFFLSDRAGFTTGTIVPAAGGWV